LAIFFPGHLWIPGEDIYCPATKNSNSEVHFAGKWICTCGISLSQFSVEYYGKLRKQYVVLEVI
jgi:hypothetical protein